MIQILVKNQELDLIDEEVIQLTNSIQDIRNVGEKTTLYSQTIQIPASKRNQEILGFLNNPLVFNDFDVNKKTRCSITIDSISVVDCDIQILNAYFNNGFEYYEASLLGLNNDIFNAIRLKYLNELDCTELDHTYTNNNIYNSWTGATGSTYNYFYPYIERGQNYSLEELQDTGATGWVLDSAYTWTPAYKVRYIFDKIFEDVGFTFESSFLENDVNFNNLYLPFVNDPRGAAESLVEAYDVGLNMRMENDVGWYFSNWGWSIRVNHSDAGRTLNTNNDWKWSATEYSGPSENIPFYLDVPATGTWKIIVTGRTTVDANPYPDTDDTFTFIAYNGTADTFILKDEETFTCRYNATGQTEIQFDASKGDIIYFTGWNNYFSQEMTTGIITGGSTHVPDITFDNTICYNIKFIPVKTDIIKNFSTIEFHLMIGEMYQSDFIKNIVNMHNLFFEKESFSNHYIIEPRDTYYDLGVEKDWSDKFDLGSQYKLSYFNDLDTRKYTFTYQQDSDYDNTTYMDKNLSKVFGQKEIEMTNEYSTTDTTVSLTFSPTICQPIEGSEMWVVPQMRDDWNTTYTHTEQENKLLNKYNMRILYRNKTGSLRQRQSELYKFNGHTMFYLYTLNHFSESYNRYSTFANIVDCNFETSGLTYILYQNRTPSEKNLFNLYWAKYINYINDKDTEILEGYFKISYLDFISMKFNDKIWIDEFKCWWNINKILSYQINTSELSKIELIKAKIGGVGEEVITFSNFAQSQNIMMGEDLPIQITAANRSSIYTSSISGWFEFQGNLSFYNEKLIPLASMVIDGGTVNNLTPGEYELIIDGDFYSGVTINVLNYLTGASTGITPTTTWGGDLLTFYFTITNPNNVEILATDYQIVFVSYSDNGINAYDFGACSSYTLAPGASHGVTGTTVSGSDWTTGIKMIKIQIVQPFSTVGNLDLCHIHYEYVNFPVTVTSFSPNILYPGGVNTISATFSNTGVGTYTIPRVVWDCLMSGTTYNNLDQSNINVSPGTSVITFPFNVNAATTQSLSRPLNVSIGDGTNWKYYSENVEIIAALYTNNATHVAPVTGGTTVQRVHFHLNNNSLRTILASEYTLTVDYYSDFSGHNLAFTSTLTELDINSGSFQDYTDINILPGSWTLGNKRYSVFIIQPGRTVKTLLYYGTYYYYPDPLL